MDDYTRRAFLRTSLPGFLGITMALPALTSLASRANAHEGRLPADGSINWDAFLEAIALEADRQHLDRWNEHTYVKHAEAITRRLNLSDPALEAAFTRTRKGIGNERIDFYDLEKRHNFHVNLLQFEPGEAIRHHDHPGMTGVLLCATGALATDNYDLLKRRRNIGSFLLKHSGSVALKKGMVSSLTSKERNIHRVEARVLTQVVDIFAPPYDRQRAAKSSWFNVDREPFKGRPGIFEATIS